MSIIFNTLLVGLKKKYVIVRCKWNPNYKKLLEALIRYNIIIRYEIGYNKTLFIFLRYRNGLSFIQQIKLFSKTRMILTFSHRKSLMKFHNAFLNKFIFFETIYGIRSLQEVLLLNLNAKLLFEILW